MRYFSKEPARRPEEFKNRKIFAWARDNDQVEVMKALGYQPVPLETADILPGLQTGLINVVPSATYYALAGQFNTVAHYMLDLRWVPIVGAAVVTRQVWEAMSPAGREQLMAAARVAGPQVRSHARKEDDEAIEAMKKRGLMVHTPTKRSGGGPWSKPTLGSAARWCQPRPSTKSWPCCGSTGAGGEDRWVRAEA